MTEKIKVFVVDDSAFMRKVISDILTESGEIDIIGTARNGNEALEKLKELKPDVITLDVEMPVMDGLTCLKHILALHTLPVIMLSSLTKEGADATIRALENGAVDFIAKPTNLFDLSGEDKKRELVEKVKVAAVSSMRKSSEAQKGFLKKESSRQPEKIKNVQIKSKNDIIKSSTITKIVAIGTSTGGPRALQEVIPKIPGNIPAAFLIVQHMPPGFTKSLADRLNSVSELTVKEAEQGDIVNAGYVYIAPGDYHMKLENGSGSIRIQLTKDPVVAGHRPSVNTMMDSLSGTGMSNLVAVIMTGMGNDGTEGIKKIKAVNKGYIIAQNEQSCVVYGMPKTAAQTGMVDAIVPLKDIAKEIMKTVGVLK